MKYTLVVGQQEAQTITMKGHESTNIVILTVMITCPLQIVNWNDRRDISKMLLADLVTNISRY